MHKILLLDEDEDMLALLSFCLIPLGFNIIKTRTESETIEYLGKDNEVDLIILEAILPGRCGLEVCKEIRERWEIPIIILTSKDKKSDIVRGLKCGADDYITKPFDDKELLARIEVLLRRRHTWNAKLESVEIFNLCFKSQALIYKEKIIPLTPKEYKLLELFLRNQSKLLTREQIIKAVWQNELAIEYHSIDSHIRNLKAKLRKKDIPIDSHLKNIWSLGFKWEVENFDY